MKLLQETKPKPGYAILFAAFFLALFLLEGFCDTGTHDDAVYADVLQRYGSLWRFLGERFQTWSSRFVGDGLSVLLCPHPMLWRILNAALSAALLLFSGIIFSKKRLPALYSLLLFASFFLISAQPHILSGAGWITTTVNYLWPFAFGVFALYPFSRLLSGESCPPAVHLLCAFFLLLSANTEQTAVILCLLHAAAFPLLRKRKQLPLWYMVHLLLLAVSIALILLCPGNRIRIARETLSHMPYFSELTIADKLFSGFLLLSHALFGGSGFSHVTLILLLLFAVYAFSETRTRRAKILSVLPAALQALSMLLHLLWQNDLWHTGLRFLGALWHNDRLPRYSDYDGTAIAFQTIFSLLLLCLLLLLSLVVFGKSITAAVLSAALSSAFLSVLMLGFSPTLFASGGRILFPCLMILLMLISLFMTRLLSRLRFPVMNADK